MKNEDAVHLIGYVISQVVGVVAGVLVALHFSEGRGLLATVIVWFVSITLCGIASWLACMPILLLIGRR
ncbi:MAG TPA: hypothetical protein PKC67_02885 [Kiritimatiellia bacterium]|nr:hypothetical protein [Kiritimatiellia bacterium]HMP33272.1 hypothetical protein [Kiritimatiellia bacterium]